MLAVLNNTTLLPQLPASGVQRHQNPFQFNDVLNDTKFIEIVITVTSISQVKMSVSVSLIQKYKFLNKNVAAVSSKLWMIKGDNSVNLICKNSFLQSYR